MSESNAAPKYVYSFSEGSREMADELGGKGANLAEMTRMGLPVPPGFTISTAACRDYLDRGDTPPGLLDQLFAALDGLEQTRGKLLGDADDPLLVSVRSGGRFFWVSRLGICSIYFRWRLMRPR